MQNPNEYRNASPAEVRRLIRAGILTGPTAGLCEGYAQANLVVLPRAQAYDFLLFAQRNPRACPLLEVTDPGCRSLREMAQDADLATDFPKYRVWEKGELVGEYTDVSAFWREDLVSFLIGCSFSFEAEMMEAGLPVRHIAQERNVPMYLTSIPCAPAGCFSGRMVVSMRPIPAAQVPLAVQVTGAMPRVHGAPVHIGDPAGIGIADISRPDFGDAVDILPGEVPVFWPCGVTPQAAIMASKPDFVITHAPGHMFITDVKNVCLKY